MGHLLAGMDIREVGTVTRNAARVALPGPDVEWITHGEGAALIGLPVTTVEWWASAGKVQTRPRAEGPTLNRESLLAHVARRSAKKAGGPHPHQRRAEPARNLVPHRPGSEWLTTREAAQLTGVGVHHLGHLIRSGAIEPQRDPTGRIWLLRASIEQLAAERNRWISWAAASELTGFPRCRVEKAVRTGLIARRPTVNRALPGLSRRSVEAWAAAERNRIAEHEAAEARAVLLTGSPRDGRRWMTAESAGRVLGIGASAVRSLVATGRLPATRRDRRVWLRLEHVLRAAAVREWHRERRALV